MDGKTSDTIYFNSMLFLPHVRTIETAAFKATHHAISMPSFSKTWGTAATTGIFNMVPRNSDIGLILWALMFLLDESCQATPENPNYAQTQPKPYFQLDFVFS